MKNHFKLVPLSDASEMENRRDNLFTVSVTVGSCVFPYLNGSMHLTVRK